MNIDVAEVSEITARIDSNDWSERYVEAAEMVLEIRSSSAWKLVAYVVPRDINLGFQDCQWIELCARPGADSLDRVSVFGRWVGEGQTLVTGKPTDGEPTVLRVTIRFDLKELPGKDVTNFNYDIVYDLVPINY